MDHIRIHKHPEGVLAIAIDRPERRNALSAAMYEALSAAVEAGEADAEVRVLLLHGAAGNFTSGNDIADFRQPAGSWPSPGMRFLQTVAAARKPLLAAVEGYAVGIGTTMLLHCDAVYAGATARFRLPFVNLGLCPEGASSYLLPRLAGYKEAARLLLFGDEFDAATAQAAGIVTEQTPEGRALERALERAAVLAHKAPEALRVTKALLRRGDARAVEDTLLYEAQCFARCRESAEAQEAFAAFFEKRPADFSRIK